MGTHKDASFVVVFDWQRVGSLGQLWQLLDSGGFFAFFIPQYVYPEDWPKRKDRWFDKLIVDPLALLDGEQDCPKLGLTQSSRPLLDYHRLDERFEQAQQRRPNLPYWEFSLSGSALLSYDDSGKPARGFWFREPWEHVIRGEAIEPEGDEPCNPEDLYCHWYMSGFMQHARVRIWMGLSDSPQTINLCLYLDSSAWMDLGLCSSLPTSCRRSNWQSVLGLLRKLIEDEPTAIGLRTDISRKAQEYVREAGLEQEVQTLPKLTA